MKDEDILQAVIIERSKSLEDALRPHIRRISICDNWFALANRAFPVISSYCKLVLFVGVTIFFVRNSILTDIVKFVIGQPDWLIFLIGCGTFVAYTFINKKWK